MNTFEYLPGVVCRWYSIYTFCWCLWQFWQTDCCTITVSASFLNTMVHYSTVLETTELDWCHRSLQIVLHTSVYQITWYFNFLNAYLFLCKQCKTNETGQKNILLCDNLQNGLSDLWNILLPIIGDPVICLAIRKYHDGDDGCDFSWMSEQLPESRWEWQELHRPRPWGPQVLMGGLGGKDFAKLQWHGCSWVRDCRWSSLGGCRSWCYDDVWRVSVCLAFGCCFAKWCKMKRFEHAWFIWGLVVSLRTSVKKKSQVNF